MAEAGKFPQVSHEEASGEIAAVYDDMRRTLRLPWVAFGCRVFATFPSFLPLAWRRSADSFGTLYFEQAADELRERAVLGTGPSTDLQARLRAIGWEEEAIENLRQVLKAFNYGNPKYLLLLTAWSERLQMRAAGGSHLPDELCAPVDRGLPEGMTPLPSLIDPDAAAEEVQSLLKSIADLHSHLGPASEFLVLARWPDVLRVITEEVLPPVVRTERYDAKASELLGRAQELVRGLPGPVGVERTELVSTCTPAEIAGLTGLLFLFQRFCTDILMSTIHITECLDGSEAATRSDFSASTIAQVDPSTSRPQDGSGR